MPSLLSLPSIALREATTTTTTASSSHFANNIAIDCDEGIEAWLVSPPPSAHTSKATTSAKNSVASDSSSTMKFFRLRRRTPNSNTSTTTRTTKPQYKLSNHSHKGPTHNGSEDASQSSSACSPTLSRSPPALIYHHHPASFTTANRKSRSSRISSAVAALWLEMGQQGAHHHGHPCPSLSSCNNKDRHHHPFPDKSRTRGTHTGPRGAPPNQRSGTTTTAGPALHRRASERRQPLLPGRRTAVHAAVTGTGGTATTQRTRPQGQSTRAGKRQTNDPNVIMKAQQHRPPVEEEDYTDEAALWETAVDPASGRTYYYHTETRETQWRKPLALASAAERAEMRAKEEQQRNFFAAMEANILKNLASGALVEVTETAVRTNEIDESKVTRGFLPTREVGQLPPPLEKPGGLVRTISTMDQQVLSELVKRQPSHRRFLSSSSTANTTLDSSPTDVLTSTFLEQKSTPAPTTNHDNLTEQTRRLSLLDDDLNEDETEFLHNIRNNKEREASMGTLLSGLPQDRHDCRDKRSVSFLGSLADLDDVDLSYSEGNLFISDDEVTALTQLARMSDQISSLEEEEEGENDLLAKPPEPMRFGATRAVSSTNPRASMANISLEVLEEEGSIHERNNTPTLEREKALENMVDPDNDRGKVLPIPSMARRNTCGTIYVGSTMSAPDKDATIKCICGVYRAHILQSEKEIPEPSEKFAVFNDVQPSLKPSSSGTGKEETRTPSLEQITTFYRDVFRRSQMEADCIIMSLIYVERLIRRTDGQLRPRNNNWRSLLFSCMILASKVWDDMSMWNADFSETCPSGVRFSLQRINQLEIEVLSALSYDVKVPASEYAKYYFLLRSMVIKSGLGSDDLQAMNPLDVEGAKRLQQMSARYQDSCMAPPLPAPLARSKSDAKVSGKRDVKARLEHMVDM